MHEPREYFVYFKARAAPNRGERADALPEKEFKRLRNKKGAGRICSPRIIAPVFALSDHLLLVTQTLSDQADRTLRPFARRRARTLRPLAVAIL